MHESVAMVDQSTILQICTEDVEEHNDADGDDPKLSLHKNALIPGNDDASRLHTRETSQIAVTRESSNCFCQKSPASRMLATPVQSFAIPADDSDNAAEESKSA